MAKDRLPQVNELIRRELSQVILREIDFPRDVLLTITRVETSSNLIQAKIYISVIPGNQVSKVLQVLNREIFNLQQIINKRFKMRPIPKIKFVEEKETQKAEKVEKLLEKIKDN